MIEVIEFKEQKVTINPELDKYNDVVSFPEKLARANEMLAKWGLPKELEEQMLAEERENAIEIEGTLSQADVATHTFWMDVAATDNQPQTIYKITALPDALKQLVKDHWGDVVKVYIQPQWEASTTSDYELIEVACELSSNS